MASRTGIKAALVEDGDALCHGLIVQRLHVWGHVACCHHVRSAIDTESCNACMQRGWQQRHHKVVLSHKISQLRLNWLLANVDVQDVAPILRLLTDLLC